MLTLTENASTIVKTLVDQNLPTEDAGLRFSQESGQESALTVTTAEQAEPGDEVVEKNGAKVFLDETAAVALGDQVLDAEVDDTGSVQFSITPATPAAPAAP